MTTSMKQFQGSYYEGTEPSENTKGIGKILWDNGDVYEGEINSHYQREGAGKMTFTDGSLYEAIG